jgi:hypothetical protein
MRSFAASTGSKRQRDRLGRPTLAVARHDVEEVKQQPAGVVRRNEGAASLVPHDHALGHQLVDRLAHRADRHPEALREPLLGRQRRARPPLAGGQLLREQLLDGLVERRDRTRLEHLVHRPASLTCKSSNSYS